jgi:hypothetical protein
MQKIKTILLITTLVLSACDGDDSNNGSDPDSNNTKKILFKLFINNFVAVDISLYRSHL